MSTAEAPPASPSSAKTLTQIRELNKIDKDISALLSAASLALSSLTSASRTAEQSFAQHSMKYHSLLSSITVRLRRQILLLEQADIPAPGMSGSPADGKSTDGGGGGGKGGSGGGIDVGAFNSRNDVVGREMEAELWRKAKEQLALLERLASGDLTTS